MSPPSETPSTPKFIPFSMVPTSETTKHNSTLQRQLKTPQRHKNDTIRQRHTPSFKSTAYQPNNVFHHNPPHQHPIIEQPKPISSNPPSNLPIQRLFHNSNTKINPTMLSAPQTHTYAKKTRKKRVTNTDQPRPTNMIRRRRTINGEGWPDPPSPATTVSFLSTTRLGFVKEGSVV